MWGDGNNPSAKDPYKHIALGHQRIDSEVKSLMASCDSATVKGLLLDVVVVLKKMMEDDPEKRITYLLAAKRLDEIWNQLRDGSR